MRVFLILAVAVATTVACATSGSSGAAVGTAQKAALDDKVFLYSCDEIADEAKGFYATRGFDERKKGLVFGPNGISLRGGSSFESSTSVSSETKVSLFGGDSETKTKVERRGKPDKSFVTEAHKGVQKLFSCWEKRDGAQVELKTVRGEALEKAVRAYDDELELMKLVDEDGYDEVMSAK